MADKQDLDEFSRALQEQILEQIRREYSETVIDRWTHPRNMGRMENPDGYGTVTGTCGDTIEIFLKMDGEEIRDCTFTTDGCGATIACGSMATEIVKGTTFTQALARVSAEQIIQRLGGLPDANLHCAQLASESVRHALADFLHQRKSPWKKAYRKI